MIELPDENKDVVKISFNCIKSSTEQTILTEGYNDGSSKDEKLEALMLFGAGSEKSLGLFQGNLPDLVSTMTMGLFKMFETIPDESARKALGVVLKTLGETFEETNEQLEPLVFKDYKKKAEAKMDSLLGDGTADRLMKALLKHLKKDSDETPQRNYPWKK
jgi:hypothetical protein